MLLVEYFDKGVEVDPERAFLVDDAGARSYRDVQSISYRLAYAFARAGITPGTKIAVYSPNATRAFECVIGMLRAGCVWVPVNVRNSIEDNVYILGNTDTEVLIYSITFRDQVREILAQVPRIRHAVCIELADEPHSSLDALLDGAPDRRVETPGAVDDLVTLFSSGGTTGRPKGVMMTHRSWEMLIANVQRLQGIDHPVHLVAAPMTHAAGGTALSMMAMGTTNVVLPGFDAERVMAAIDRHRVTHLFLPPTAIYRMLAHPNARSHDYSSLRYFTYGGAPMAPDKIKEALQVFGPVMMTSFGQTEMGVNATFFSPQEHARALRDGDDGRFLSCGKASPFYRVEIMDAEGKLLPAGTHGEIVVRSTCLMKGYYKDPEETARAQAFGWHHTGDIGVKDEAGWIYLTDRKRDMIISGGFNIFPSEIEKALLAHPAVQDCAVVGVPHPDWGEAVTAVVELKAGHRVEIADLEACCRKRLASYKVPKSFEIWPELPRSPVGKLLRRKVRDVFWQGRERMI
jgi:acyl-CoA synthetase (AMP-forming)/AMP-acid ligase II